MTEPLPQRRQQFARLILSLAFVALGLWIASGFLRAILWGAILAIALAPLFERASRRWPGRHTMLAAIFTLSIAIFVLGPIAAGIVQAAREAQQLAAWLGSARENGLLLPAWAAQLPVGREAFAAWWQATLATPDQVAASLHRVNAAVVGHSRLLGADVLRRLVAFTFALLTLFFLLRDRDHVARQLRAAGHRLFGASGEAVAEQILLSVRGTINGLVLVGIGEGAVMALAYLALGVPHPLLLGAATAVAAMIPLGAAVMIAVAAFLLLAAGSVAAAVAIVVIGLVVVGIADHLVRPALIGGATRLPFVWVLVGILGGVETLGLIGLFVGPAAMAVLIMLWRQIAGEPATASE